MLLHVVSDQHTPNRVKEWKAADKILLWRSSTLSN